MKPSDRFFKDSLSYFTKPFRKQIVENALLIWLKRMGQLLVLKWILELLSWLELLMRGQLKVCLLLRIVLTSFFVLFDMKGWGDLPLPPKNSSGSFRLSWVLFGSGIQKLFQKFQNSFSLKVWTIFLNVVLNTKRAVVTLQNGVVSSTLALTNLLIWLFWRMQMFLHVMQVFVIKMVLFLLLSQKFCVMVIMILTDVLRFLNVLI